MVRAATKRICSIVSSRQGWLRGKLGEKRGCGVASTRLISRHTYERSFALTRALLCSRWDTAARDAQLHCEAGRFRNLQASPRRGLLLRPHSEADGQVEPHGENG